MVYVPAGVADVTVMVSMSVVPAVLGLTGFVAKLHEAPNGSPLHERVTGWLAPLVRVAVIVLEPEPVVPVLMLPEFDSE